jgi:dipeptidyl aminopeptidase/acylaminoacyl peptidase
VENSFFMAMALKNAGVPVELHILPEGEHGLSLASTLVRRPDGSGYNEACQCWIELASAWMARLCDEK